MRILYVSATYTPPSADQRSDRFSLLSERLEGDILQPVWFSRPDQIEAVFGPGAYPVYSVGRFRYHWFLAWRHAGLWRRVLTFWFYLRTGVRLQRQRSCDCIVAYSHMTTGVYAAVLKLLTRCKLVIEIATAPQLAALSLRERRTPVDYLRRLYSDICLHLSMAVCDRAHFLFPRQLETYPLLRRKPASVFHEFVPISAVHRHEPSSDPFILLVGAPWYLKGADVLVRAFRGLAAEFPGVKLKILGFYPDRKALEALIAGHPQIEILKARPNKETLEIISQATVLVLPSRCEGMGRVLLEAMAAGIPVVGSDVGGIPSLIREGENGYLVPVGDAHALEVRLRELLSDRELRRRMGDLGYERAHTEFTEKAYVESFARMVEATVRRVE